MSFSMSWSANNNRHVPDTSPNVFGHGMQVEVDHRNTLPPHRTRTEVSPQAQAQAQAQVMPSASMRMNIDVNSKMSTGPASALPLPLLTLPETFSSPILDGGNLPMPDNQGQRQTSVSETSVEGKDKERSTTSSACQECRNKHLKCDGLAPCSRCTSNGVMCEYRASRRGFKSARRKPDSTQTQSGKSNSAVTSGSLPSGSASPGDISGALSNIPPTADLRTDPNHRLMAFSPICDLPVLHVGQDVARYQPKALTADVDVGERCIQAFYYNFWPAHPFCLPKANHYQFRKEKLIAHLEAAMRYVGSFYVFPEASEALGTEAERLLYQGDCREDGYKVQAMLILALGMDGSTHQKKALNILKYAQELACRIGMNKREYAAIHGNGSPILAESWRRTWWDLYVVDGFVAGVHQNSLFPMKDIEADVELPCEEHEYQSGAIPPPHTIQDFDEETFNGEDFQFSSFTYRIAAIRNLGRMIASNVLQNPDSISVMRIDAHLVNWRLHLPPSKRELIDRDGKLDEMLFQGKMITEAATVYLHRALSELDSSITAAVNACAPHTYIAPGYSFNLHTCKYVDAAKSISSLIQLPTPAQNHTHFFTCVITLSSVVHLSCWSLMVPALTEGDEDVKQQLRLNIGGLKELQRVWPSAQKALGQVKGVAHDVWEARKNLLEQGNYWGQAIERDEVMRRMIEDQDALEDLQLLGGDNQANLQLMNLDCQMDLL